MKKLQHQKDINGCGIASMANLLDRDYDLVKKDFERKFYTIEKGVKIFDTDDKNYKDLINYNEDKTEIFVRNFLENDSSESD